MKRYKLLVGLLGAVSISCCGALVFGSFVTYHPSIQAAASRNLLILLVVSFGAGVATLVAGQATVAFADAEHGPEAKGVRNLSLWLSLPPLIILAVLFIGGLQHAREMAAMGGH